MKSAAIVVVTLYVAIIAGWLTAVCVDASHSVWGWLAVDLLASPVGVVRGWLMWVGLAG